MQHVSALDLRDAHICKLQQLPQCSKKRLFLSAAMLIGVIAELDTLRQVWKVGKDPHLLQQGSCEPHVSHQALPSWRQRRP